MLAITGFIEIAGNYLLGHRNCFSNLGPGRRMNRWRRHHFLRRSMICLNRAALIISASVVFAGAVEAGTNFYVDPDWTGTKSGTQSHPFAVLDKPAWNRINAALASGDVTIYFSARKAGNDPPDYYNKGGNEVQLEVDLTKKTNRGSFHL